LGTDVSSRGSDVYLFYATCAFIRDRKMV